MRSGAASVGSSALEQPERLERGDALRRRRQLEHLDVAVARAQRLDPARRDTPRGRPPRASGPPRSPGDRAARRSRRARARRSARSVAASSGRRRARRRGARARAPAGAAGARAAPQRRRSAPTAKPRSAASIASARHASSPSRPWRSASAAQPATAPGTVTERGPVCSTGSSARPAPAPARPRRGRRAAVAPDDREAVAADARRHRLGHAEHRGGRERGVGGVAAALERAQPGSRRERLARRHHRLAATAGGRPNEQR